MNYSADEIMKSSPFLPDVLLDPATSHSEEPSDASSPQLFKTKGHFEYLHAPGNEYRDARFQAGMVNFASSENSTVVSGGFPWEVLPNGTKIVDVGGGVGSASHEIMKKNPTLKFVIQDLQEIIDQTAAVSTRCSCRGRACMVTVFTY